MCCFCRCCQNGCVKMILGGFSLVMDKVRVRTLSAKLCPSIEGEMYVCVYLQGRRWWRREEFLYRMTGRWLQTRRESGSRCLESLRTVKQQNQQQWYLTCKNCHVHAHEMTQDTSNTPPAGPRCVCGDRRPIHYKTSHPPPQEAQRNSGKVTWKQTWTSFRPK